MKSHTQLARRFFATLLFSTLVLVFPNSPATADSLEDGIQAYKAGDYKKALEILKPLAERGDAKAQTRLGWMYKKGRGVVQDYQQFVHWYRKAAEQGDAGGQSELGNMYHEGQGVAQDLPLEVKTGSGVDFLEHPLLRGGFLDDIYECFQDPALADEFMTVLSEDIASFTPLYALRGVIGGWAPG